MNDHNLLFSGIEQKDLLIFELLYELHYFRLCSMAEQIVKNQPEAESVVMGVFEILWNTRMKYDNLPGIKTYLFREVFNNSLKELESNELKQTRIIDSEKIKKYQYCGNK